MAKEPAWWAVRLEWWESSRKESWLGWLARTGGCPCADVVPELHRTREIAAQFARRFRTIDDHALDPRTKTRVVKIGVIKEK